MRMISGEGKHLTKEKNNTMKKNILMFDVESTSLYGPGFAVGAIVADDNNHKQK